MSASKGRAFEHELRQIAQDSKAKLPKFERPKELYHYTDAKGLLGILDSQSFWMRADDETKDPLELRYANRVFREAWMEFADSEEVIEGLDILNSNPFLPLFGTAPHYGIYFVSFCVDGDVPHHWQNFSNGGRGFSIGFPCPSDTTGWTTSPRRGTSLLLEPAIYGREAQRNVVRAVLKRAKELLGPVVNFEVQFALRQVMGEILPFFKDSSFREEREWRFVATRLSEVTPNTAEVMVHDGRLAAVLRLRRRKSELLPISKIVVGPRMPRGSHAHIEALMAQKGATATIENSKWQEEFG